MEWYNESNSEKEYLKVELIRRGLFKKKKTIIRLRTELWKKEAIYLKIGGSDFQADLKDDEIDVSLASCEDHRKIFVAKM